MSCVINVMTGVSILRISVMNKDNGDMISDDEGDSGEDESRVSGNDRRVVDAYEYPGAAAAVSPWLRCRGGNVLTLSKFGGCACGTRFGNCVGLRLFCSSL
jgi:hypothetical protein